MQRTIATLLLLAWGAPTAAGVAAEQGSAAARHGDSAASGSQQVARYRLSDQEDAAAAGQAAYSATSSGGLQTASYYDSVYMPTPPAYTPTSYATAGTASPGYAQPAACGHGAGCNQCQSCDECVCDILRVEYLMWWTRGRNTPPLATTGVTGTLDDPDTVVLFGGEEAIGTDLRHGGRITFNHLMLDGCTWGDIRFWGISDGSESFFSDDDPLFRPFFNVLLDQQDALPVNVAGTADGSLTVTAKNDLIGGDAWFRRNLRKDCCSRLDVLAGYMFTRMDDSVLINSTTTGTDPGDVTTFDITFDLTDHFRTENEFHGIQLGFLAERRRGAVSLELLAKLAMGNMRQQVTITGVQTQTPAGGPPTTVTGGLLAQPTNIGTFERDRFAVSPEINLNLIYEVNACWRVMLGYSFIYWDDVVLAGNQIDLGVNPSQQPGPIVGEERPRFDFNETDFWVMGLNFGAEYRW